MEKKRLYCININCDYTVITPGTDQVKNCPECGGELVTKDKIDFRSNVYTFFWKNGDRDVLKGSTPADALNNAGYGAGALGALDFYMIGDNTEYEFANNEWIKKEV